MDATVTINVANHVRNAIPELKTLTVVAHNLPRSVIAVMATEAPIATAAQTTGITAAIHAPLTAIIAQIAATRVQQIAIIVQTAVITAATREPQTGITVQTAAIRAHTTATIAQTDEIIVRIGVITAIITAATTAAIRTRGHT